MSSHSHIHSLFGLVAQLVGRLTSIDFHKMNIRKFIRRLRVRVSSGSMIVLHAMWRPAFLQCVANVLMALNRLFTVVVREPRREASFRKQLIGAAVETDLHWQLGHSVRAISNQFLTYSVLLGCLSFLARHVTSLPAQTVRPSPAFLLTFCAMMLACLLCSVRSIVKSFFFSLPSPFSSIVCTRQGMGSSTLLTFPTSFRQFVQSLT
ncbi:hypothetical protein LZ30DRAFT_462392 [Colletotrichum cereale]|nr:hypothetical protein LZ30DRAFT_462392 [Colletotrichum cereale]